MNIEKEREAFENWLIKKFKVKANDYALSFVDGKYQCIPTKVRWESWLASKSSAVPDGYVLIPKELSKDTLINIASVCIGDDFANLEEARELYEAAIQEQEKPHD